MCIRNFDIKEWSKRDKWRVRAYMNTKSRKLIKMSWEEFDKAVDVLVVQIKKERYAYKAVMGIPRGGLILAVCLSHRLNIPLVFKPIQGTLLVDDIADTGVTLDTTYFANNKFSGVATLYQCDRSDFLVGHFARRKSKDEYIIFPWEVP